MRILITNDDGINAPGLQALAEALAPMGEVVVCAPEREQSCAGHAITLHKPLRRKPVDLGGLPVEAYTCSGTPADCVSLGRYGETRPPDLVVSGINAGANLGEEVYYSGTVAAAMEACLQGLRAMAVSVTAYHDCNFSAAADFVRRFAPAYAAAETPEGVLLNVNVPSLSPPLIAGIRTTRLGRRAYSNLLEMRRDPRGRPYFWYHGEATELDSADGTDIAAIQDGMISVTPVRFDVTAYDATDYTRELVRRATQ